MFTDKLRKFLGIITPQELSEMMAENTRQVITELKKNDRADKEAAESNVDSIQQKDSVIQELQLALQLERNQKEEEMTALRNQIDALQRLLTTAQNDGYKALVRDTKKYYEELKEQQAHKPQTGKWKITMPMSLHNELIYVSKVMKMPMSKIVCMAARKEIDCLRTRNQQLFDDIEGLPEEVVEDVDFPQEE